MYSKGQIGNNAIQLHISQRACRVGTNMTGIGILEVLISMAILSLATITLLRVTSSALASSIENTESHQMALIGTDLLNVLAAHIAPMDLQASKTEIRSKVEKVSAMIEKESNLLMESKGYKCNNGEIQQVRPSGNTSTSKSTLLKNWANGPPTCVSFTVDLPTSGSNASGVWVQAHLSRLSLTQEDSGAKSIVITSLIAPF